MPIGFLKSKPKPKVNDDVLASLDIGTEFVKVLIARLDGENLEIIGVSEKRQELSDMHSGAIADIAGVIKTCEEALIEAEEMAKVEVKRTVIGIAGELVKGTTDTITYRRPNPEIALTVGEMENIIEKVQERAQQKAKQNIAAETGADDAEVRLVNSALVGINIDGYKVSNPIDFQGREVSVQLYTAFAPMVHIGALERVANELSLDLVAVAAEPFAVSRSVVGTDSSSAFSAILIDVGGGTTDIAVVSDGGVEGTKMFAIGGRSFTRMVSNDLEVDYNDAEKLKINVESDKIRKEIKEAAVKSLQKTLDVWHDGVELALSEFEAVDHLPIKILLCGGGSSLTLLSESLKKWDWSDELAFSKKPVIKHVTMHDILGIKNNTEYSLDHRMVTAMGLLRVGYDTIAADSEDVVSKKINQIMRN